MKEIEEWLRGDAQREVTLRYRRELRAFVAEAQDAQFTVRMSASTLEFDSMRVKPAPTCAIWAARLAIQRLQWKSQSY